MSNAGSNKQQAEMETAIVSTNSSVKSTTSVRSASRPTTKKEALSSKPVRPLRSLRAKVLTRSASIRSSMSEDTPELSPSTQPPSPTDNIPTASQRVTSWDQETNPPRPIESDDELSEGSLTSEPVGRASMILYTTRRTGVEMDAATKTANEMLQKAKDAVEAAGNMKRECKQTTLECLQTLYETVLSLSDSCSRHNNNLEKEKHRHALEIVRIERAHNKLLTQTITNIHTQLDTNNKYITENCEETKAIRSWLGYETQEPYKKIEEIAKMMANMERSIGELAQHRHKENKSDLEPLIKDQGRLSSNIEKLSNQLDDLRRHLDQIKEGTKKVLSTNMKILEVQNNQQDQKEMAIGQEEDINKSLAEVKAALELAEKNICQTIATQPTPQTVPVSINEGITDHLQPITERLEAVSSELRTIREIRSRTPPPATNLGAEMALADLYKSAGTTSSRPTYAQAAQKPRPPRPNHTLIVSSTDPLKTGENVIDNIRLALDLKHSGAKIDRVRKGRNQKVILSCSKKEDLTLVKTKIKSDNGLKAEVPKMNNPLAKVKDVLSYHTDIELAQFIKSQNSHLLQGLKDQDIEIRVRYRKKARNPLECHVVLELSPEVHKRFIECGKIYVDLQRRPIEDQSPLVQCTKCLGFGHTRTLCREEDQLCSYCGEKHTWEECTRRVEGRPPTCKNCQRTKTKLTNQDHNAFSGECPEKQKWDSIARSRITYC